MVGFKVSRKKIAHFAHPFLILQGYQKVLNFTFEARSGFETEQQIGYAKQIWDNGHLCSTNLV